VFSKEAISTYSKKLSQVHSKTPSKAYSRGSIFQRRAMEGIRMDQENLSRKIDADKLAF